MYEICANTFFKGKFMCTPKFLPVRSSHDLCARTRVQLKGNIAPHLVAPCTILNPFPHAQVQINFHIPLQNFIN